MTLGDGIVGGLHWDACKECFFGDSAGECLHPRGPSTEDDGDNVICTNYAMGGEWVEFTPELEAKIDAENQTFLFPDVRPFRPRIFEKEGKKFIKT